MEDKNAHSCDGTYALHAEPMLFAAPFMNSCINNMPPHLSHDKVFLHQEGFLQSSKMLAAEKTPLYKKLKLYINTRVLVNRNSSYVNAIDRSKSKYISKSMSYQTMITDSGRSCFYLQLELPGSLKLARSMLMLLARGDDQAFRRG